MMNKPPTEKFDAGTLGTQLDHLSQDLFAPDQNVYEGALVNLTAIVEAGRKAEAFLETAHKEPRSKSSGRLA
jgi:hypothetical protein